MTNNLVGYHTRYARHHLFCYARVSNPIQTQFQVFRLIYYHHCRVHTPGFPQRGCTFKLVEEYHTRKSFAGNKCFGAEEV